MDKIIEEMFEVETNIPKINLCKLRLKKNLKTALLTAL